MGQQSGWYVGERAGAKTSLAGKTDEQSNEKGAHELVRSNNDN